MSKCNELFKEVFITFYFEPSYILTILPFDLILFYYSFILIPSACRYYRNMINIVI